MEVLTDHPLFGCLGGRAVGIFGLNVADYFDRTFEVTRLDGDGSDRAVASRGRRDFIRSGSFGNECAIGTNRAARAVDTPTRQDVCYSPASCILRSRWETNH